MLNPGELEEARKMEEVDGAAISKTGTLLLQHTPLKCNPRRFVFSQSLPLAPRGQESDQLCPLSTGVVGPVSLPCVKKLGLQPSTQGTRPVHSACFGKSG